MICATISLAILFIVNRKKYTGSSTFSSTNHIDIHLRVCISFFNKAAAIDIINTCSRLDIHSNFTVLFIKSKGAAFTRIFSIVATTHKVFYDNRFITWICLLYVYSDVTTNTTSLVIAAIDILKVTTGDGQSNIAFDVSFVRAATDIFDL